MAKSSCKDAFSQALLELARANPHLYLLATDSRGSAGTTSFFEQYPQQSIEIGIAEQNAVAISAGLAMTGKTVFISGPACFLTGRAFEQIKVDVAYNKANVKVVGVSAGVSYGPLGGTHTTLGDFSCLRCLAEISIYAPCDATQTKWITRMLAAEQGPAYMRMGRGAVENVYTDNEHFEKGKAKCLCYGEDITLISCGETVSHALRAAQQLKKDGIRATVLDCFSLRPFDTSSVLEAAAKTGHVITIEEHCVSGGLGELVAHTLCENNKETKLKILGFPDQTCRIGSSAELFEVYGLDAKGIADCARIMLGE